MALLDDVLASLAQVNTNVEATDAKLDEIRSFIQTLKAGTVTEADLQKIAALAASAQTGSQKVLTEADELDE